ncbi:MAG: DUF4202 domain-containing protein [Bryobacteraceae bacterium]
MDLERFAKAIAAINARNADDPNRITVAGEVRPKELAHAEMVTAWVRRLRPDASEALLLAARAHHVRRWAIPRASYPEGRVGYLEWRKALQQMHAADLRSVLEGLGYEEAVIARACDIVRKRDLTRDAEVQTLEDAVCMVFLETQYEETLARIGEAKMAEVLEKTLRKMSAEGRRLAAEWVAARG